MADPFLIESLCVVCCTQWSRTQFLGEIARGHWGLCRASVAEIAADPAERWAALDGRLVFAPKTEMTEEFIRNGARDMEREAQFNARAGTLVQHAEEEEMDEADEVMAPVDEAVETAEQMVAVTAGGDGDEEGGDDEEPPVAVALA